MRVPLRLLIYEHRIFFWTDQLFLDQLTGVSETMCRGAALLLAFSLSLIGGVFPAGSRMSAMVAWPSPSAWAPARPSTDTLPRAATQSHLEAETPTPARAIGIARRLPFSTHLVEAGESLSSIAAADDISVEALVYNNELRDPDLLQVGDRLRVPHGDGALYTVQPGEDLASIARSYHVSAADIARASALPGEPSAGDTLLIPLPPDRFVKPVVRVAALPLAVPPFAPRTDLRFHWPVSGVVTQAFWARHPGVDIAAAYGSAVRAAASGTVSAAGWVAVGGLRVCVRHDAQLETCYYHLSAAALPVGAPVVAGAVVGRVGLTGVTTGPHVHWEARSAERLFDPRVLLAR